MDGWPDGWPAGESAGRGVRKLLRRRRNGVLVRLTSNTSGKMIMLAEHAHVFFGWIGKEATARGVFTREQLPEAIARLRQGVDEEKRDEEKRAREKQKREDGNGNGEEKAGEDEEKRPGEPVTLARRAQPLLRLMEQTLKEGGFILWEAGGDF
jgi:hypothetical protein